ncbi:unnamed protein product [Clonostachys solani]|uniref:Uncharacterized protein n=1 Tax=Clonostachys solani TaxID=160281 RepID=A0A9N9ZCI7_9HYPO|nr:unnamed protein product [Clonostachys solani]
MEMMRSWMLLGIEVRRYAPSFGEAQIYGVSGGSHRAGKFSAKYATVPNSWTYTQIFDVQPSVACVEA